MDKRDRRQKQYVTVRQEKLKREKGDRRCVIKDKRNKKKEPKKRGKIDRFRIV